ncbi:4216_t:CDS:2 [Paraglomus occultum]|uniref:4216_t:CDS:1 n=1 Tax=Paraglomus occultum TaxID=144539 RepID=A0A9N9FJV1_9GLOM|nr:4216_t:CDS:2 [Paraglomus occultum]
MSTASSAAEDSDESRYPLSYVSKKRKRAEVESTSAPKPRLQSDLSVTETINQLRLSSSLSSSYDLSNLASGFEMNADTNNGANTSDADNINYINEADEKEIYWWSTKASLGSLDIDEKRLPLVLARDVTFSQFAKRVEIIKARRFLDYQNGTVTIIELPTAEHEITHAKFTRQFTSAFNNVSAQDDICVLGAIKLYTNLPSNEYQEPDACFIPRRLLGQPAQNPCDRNGNPWPSIIFEVASSETLQHVKAKINKFWLAPNRCEDVIVIKLGNWERRCRNTTTRRPLRRLRCLKFCRAATLRQNPNATRFEPIEEIEFGSVYANGRESQFCSNPHMKWITIDCDCIYADCAQPPPLPSFYTIISSQQPYPQPQSLLQRPGVAIDLYDIQQDIFLAMGPN